MEAAGVSDLKGGTCYEKIPFHASFGSIADLAACGLRLRRAKLVCGFRRAKRPNGIRFPEAFGDGGGKSIKVGFVISALNEPIMHAYNDYMQKAMKQAAEAAGYTLDYVSTSSDGDVNKEFSNVQDMVTSGCKVVIINAIDNVASLPRSRNAMTTA